MPASHMRSAFPQVSSLFEGRAFFPLCAASVTNDVPIVEGDVVSAEAGHTWLHCLGAKSLERAPLALCLS